MAGGACNLAGRAIAIPVLTAVKLHTGRCPAPSTTTWPEPSRGRGPRSALDRQRVSRAAVAQRTGGGDHVLPATTARPGAVDRYGRTSASPRYSGSNQFWLWGPQRPRNRSGSRSAWTQLSCGRSSATAPDRPFDNGGGQRRRSGRARYLATAPGIVGPGPAMRFSDYGVTRGNPRPLSSTGQPGPTKRGGRRGLARE